MMYSQLSFLKKIKSYKLGHRLKNKKEKKKIKFVVQPINKTGTSNNMKHLKGN